MAPGQLLGSRVPTKDEEYNINWRNNIIAVIIIRARDTMKAIWRDKFKTDRFELNYLQENMICHK